MHGHGTFVYRPDFAIERFGSATGAADAAKAMDMSHAWLRVHNKNGAWLPDANMALAEAFRAAGINVGVWGWNDGNDVDQDIANAVAAIDRYEPYAYIADIENGVSDANWTVRRATKFATAVKNHLGGKPLVVSSFGYIATHEPEIMTAIDGIADFFAPQVYWFNYPKPWMLPPDDPDLGNLPTDNAAAYAKVCLHHWRRTVTKPLVLTGQAYWGEAENWTQRKAENKLKEFLDEFDQYDMLAGLNWWNLADPSAMSARMRSRIAAARLGDKFAAVTPEQPPRRGRSQGGAQTGSRGARSGGLTRREVRGPGRDVRFVAGEGLFLRSSPDGDGDDNIIATLHYGDVAKVSGAATANGYVRARVEIDGGPLQGFLATTYLRKPETPEIERLVQEATDEWRRFARGNGIETVEPYSSYINEMWAARGRPDLTGRNTDWFWSAAFISFILENANYTKTKLSTRHSVYIHEAIQNRITGANRNFWGYRRREAKPQVGDIICQWRERETTFDEAEMSSDFPSHTDVVIAVRPSACITLGGNVANENSGGRGVSVDTKIWTLDENGFLPDRRNVFALMKNNFRPRSAQALA